MSVPLLVAIPPALFLVCGLVGRRRADAHVELVRRFVATLALAVFGTSLISAVALWRQGASSASLDFGSGLSIGVRVDGLSVVVALLIGFVASVIVRYAHRYLDGEPTRGRFFRWVGFTTGSVLFFVLADDLLVMTAAWMATSFGLHRLLLLHPERAGAHLAARHKFLVSRLGDVFLLSALGLTYWAFGTLRFEDLFAAIEGSADGVTLWPVSAAAVLFALGAMTKSAQFPLHGWLPDTMETPTPVSALMHAGIINAGGFLVIRLSPLLVLEPLALELLAVVGATTAVFGALVMLTQPSVKRALAYSTIAQMGFMMLQCGLGAFSAALLHLVAHSLYKAHAFLNSGSVLETAARTRVGDHVSTPVPRVWTLVAAVVLGASLSFGSAIPFGQMPDGKPGGLVLGVVLSLALAHLLVSTLRTGRRDVALVGLSAAVGVCVAYRTAYAGFDALLANFAPVATPVGTPIELPLLAILSVCLLGFWALQGGLPGVNKLRFVQTLYVHASNGFYMDIPVRRLVTRLWGEPARS